LCAHCSTCYGCGDERAVEGEMAWGFRKSKRLLPGVRLNIGKRGASVRVGGKGLGYTTGTSGSRVSASIPGTGLSYRQKLSGSASEQLEPPRQSRADLIVRGVLALIALLALAWMISSNGPFSAPG
jgi:hypothetical protein